MIDRTGTFRPRCCFASAEKIRRKTIICGLKSLDVPYLLKPSWVGNILGVVAHADRHAGVPPGLIAVTNAVGGALGCADFGWDRERGQQ
jgi:hypothetical protein